MKRKVKDIRTWGEKSLEGELTWWAEGHLENGMKIKGAGNTEAAARDSIERQPQKRTSWRT